MVQPLCWIPFHRWISIVTGIQGARCSVQSRRNAFATGWARPAERAGELWRLRPCGDGRGCNLHRETNPAIMKPSSSPIGSRRMVYIYILTWLGYIDGKCYHIYIYTIHTDPSWVMIQISDETWFRDEKPCTTLGHFMKDRQQSEARHILSFAL